MTIRILRVAIRTTASISVAFCWVYSSAQANTVAFYVTDNGVSVSGSSTNIGTLSAPSNIIFSDNLTQNISATSVTTIDDWSFSLPPSVFGATVTGDQLWLNNFNVSGVVDSFALYSGTVGSGTLLETGMPTGSFSSFLLDDLANSGNYYLQVQATLGPGSPSAPTIGSYTGTLVAAPVPLPATLPFLITGLAGLGFLPRVSAKLRTADSRAGKLSCN